MKNRGGERNLLLNRGACVRNGVFFLTFFSFFSFLLLLFFSYAPISHYVTSAYRFVPQYWGRDEDCPPSVDQCQATPRPSVQLLYTLLGRIGSANYINRNDIIQCQRAVSRPFIPGAAAAPGSAYSHPSTARQAIFSHRHNPSRVFFPATP